jgi:hypothetical protein
VCWLLVNCNDDDTILLCPSIKGLQCVLNNCVAAATDALALTFNASNSMCLAIGKPAKLPFQSMLLGSSRIEWVNSTNYLGVKLCDGKVCTLIVISANRISLQCAIAGVFAHAPHLDEII